MTIKTLEQLCPLTMSSRRAPLRNIPLLPFCYGHVLHRWGIDDDGYEGTCWVSWTMFYQHLHSDDENPRLSACLQPREFSAV